MNLRTHKAVTNSNSCVQEPLKLDIVISFPDHGFHLRFDPWSQVLFHIHNDLISFSMRLISLCIKSFFYTLGNGFTLMLNKYKVSVRLMVDTEFCRIGCCNL